MKTLTDAYEECRRVNKYYGTPFFHAINSFPKQQQLYMHSVFAYDRIVQEMLQNPKEGITRQRQVKAVKNWNRALEEGLRTSSSANPYLQAIIHTIKVFDIPKSYFKKYTIAVLDDHSTNCYDSYTKLQKIIDNTAGKVAEMNGIILGVKSFKGKKLMLNLARVYHLTKMLGKLGKDYDKKNKCHLSKKDMKKFNYTFTDLKDHIVNDNWRYLMEHYLKRIQDNLDSVEKNIISMPPSTQLAFENTVQIYNSIIESIRKKDYDVFSYQPRLSSSLKLRHMLPSFGNLLR